MWLSSRSVKGVHTQYYEQPLRSYYSDGSAIHYNIDSTKLIDRIHGLKALNDMIYYNIPKHI